MEDKLLNVPTMAQLMAEGKSPEVVFWVGCAGSFDQRAQKVTRSFVEILNHVGIDFAVLGTEESCTGDPARRAGNEFVFQMLAQQNIMVMNGYEVKKIVTACPHCFNVLKNEYPKLGGSYEVMHHSSFLQSLINEGKLAVEGGAFKGKRITFHDSCYLGRANAIYEAPRSVLAALDAELVEMKATKSKGLCCGAGGAQMWKEDEPGDKRINMERTEQALEVQPSVIAVSCPFCNTMMTDGVKSKEKQEDIAVYDLAELIAQSL
ncbi:MAG: (Fe-S)-binding protein [Saprospiraceae bacterium]|nr:(Fe-S)-binding protein [Saprospiraceae bacterium]